MFEAVRPLTIASFVPLGRRPAVGAAGGASAALHFRAGFPRGLVGVGPTFACGLVLGEPRRRTGGLIAPLITQALTHPVIVTIDVKP